MRRSEEAKWLSLPRQLVLTRRLHVGGKLQTSVETPILQALIMIRGTIMTAMIMLFLVLKSSK